MSYINQARANAGYRPIVYIEGVRFPVMGGSCSSTAGSIARISLLVRYDPRLWRSLLTVAAASNGNIHENGLSIVYDVTMRGIQENTVVTVFGIDQTSNEEIFIGQGQVTSAEKTSGREKTMIKIEAAMTGYFLDEITTQMMSLQSSLQLKEGWENQLGVSSVNDVVTTIKADGIAKGTIKIMDKAGSNTDLPSNLVWRLHRLFHRMSFLDNSKALGNFAKTKLDVLLDEALSEMKADLPLSATLQKIHALVNYMRTTNLCPSYLNAAYSDESGNSSSLNDCKVSVDQDSTHVDYLDSIASGKFHLKTNEVVYLPNLFLCPPPRCNVLFPSQYEISTDTIDFSQRATRGIVNVAGEGTLTVGSQTDALVMPDSVRDGIASKGKYYVDPEERIQGISWSTFATSRPQAAEELGSDYMKGYMKTIYAHQLFMGHKMSLQTQGFNPKPIVGLPMLILSADGDHVITELMGLTHTFAPSNISTSYLFGFSRYYDEPIPSDPANFWYDQDAYSQDNVGAYIYPRIVGQYYEVDIATLTSAEENPDRSILVHLFGAGDSMEEAEAAYESADATKKAVEALYNMYKEAPSPTWFERWYGRRAPISIDHWFKDFFKCRGTDDKFIYYGGYTLATNSVTTETEDQPADQPMAQVAPEPSDDGSEKLPLDARLAGLFVTERQNIYINPAIRMATMDKVPVEISDPPTLEQLQENVRAIAMEGLFPNG